MFLKGERVALRAPDPADIDRYLSWFSDPEVFQYLLRVRPMSRSEEEEWLRGLHKRPDDLVLAIVELAQGALIGACGLHRISPSNRSAELGIAIGEKAYWGRGYGREALGLLCEYGFEVLNLNRIGLSVYEYNVRGLRCYEKAGFRLEGRRREGRYWGGRYWDILEMGLLAPEWRAASNGCGARNSAGALGACQSA